MIILFANWYYLTGKEKEREGLREKNGEGAVREEERKEKGEEEGK